MKLNDIFTIKLDEVRQAPSNLKQFANSPEAEGIMAGFEAEMIFRGWNSKEDYSDDPQPDYSDNQQTGNIENIIDFFNDGDVNGRQELGALQREMENDWLEWLATASSEHFYDNAERIVRDWIEGDEWDWNDEITDALEDAGYSQEDIEAAFAAQKAVHAARRSHDNADIESARMKYKDGFALWMKGHELASAKLDELTEKAIEEGNADYQAAQQNSREAFEEDAIQDEWLEAEGLDNMVAVSNRYSGIITWPHWDYGDQDNEGTYSEDAARQLADSLVQIIPGDQKIRATNWAGKDKDPDTWYLESDASIHPDDNDDLAVEIVSPPMPLKQCLEVMDKFFKWAEKNDGYTNESTGFHMGVSMPEQDSTKVDFTKLALFLGDKYVLEQFGRMGNNYCLSALKKIEAAIRNNKVSPQKALEALRKGLDRTASEILANNEGFGKFTSINPKSKYIEFRSAGGEDYSEDIDKLQSTLGRYAQAMWIASHPEAYRDEYQKKLYKLLSESEDKTDTIKELAKLSAGKATEANIDGWADRMRAILQRSNANRMAARGDKLLVWTVKQKMGSASYSDVVAKTAAEAIKICQDYDRDWNRSPASAFIATPVKAASPEQVARYEAKQSGSKAATQWEVYDKNTGNSVHKFDNPENTVQAGVGYALGWYTALPEDERPAAAGQLGVRPVPTGEGEMWEAYRRDNGQVVHRFHNPSGNAAGALDITKAWYDTQPPMNVRVWDLKVRRVPEITPDITNPNVQHEYISDPHGNYVIRRKDEDGRPTGPVLFRFRAANIDAAAVKALTWARANNLQNQIRLSHVGDVSIELLNPQPSSLPSQTDVENRLGWGSQVDDANYEVIDNNNGYASVFKIIANTTDEATRKFLQWKEAVGIPANSREYGLRGIPRAAQQSGGNEFTGQWEVISRSTGEVVYTFGTGIGNSMADANGVAERWAQRTGFDDPIRVRPQMR